MRPTIQQLREAAAIYRQALVPDAKLPAFDNWRTTQSNLGLALVEIARIAKDKSGLPDAAAALHEAIVSAKTPAEVVVDRKRLAETYDQLSAEGDPAYLRKAADAWGDLAANYGDASPADRACVQMLVEEQLQRHGLSPFRPAKAYHKRLRGV